MTVGLHPCGTEDAYRTHIANGEHCQRCREAHMKRARARAQSRALKRLARCYPIEYAALYQQELAAELAEDGTQTDQAA